MDKPTQAVAANEMPEDVKMKETRLAQMQHIERVQPSGRVSFNTQYDLVLMFHAGALLKGVSHIGKSSEPTPEAVLKGRMTIIDEEVNKELMPALLKAIEQGGAISLEHRAEMMDHIVDSVYVLLGLAANLGLPFDAAFDTVHNANMKKLFLPGAPIFREDGKLLKPEGWEPPTRQMFELLKRSYEMELKAQPEKQNNLGVAPSGEGETSAPKIIVPETRH